MTGFLSRVYIAITWETFSQRSYDCPTPDLLNKHHQAKYAYLGKISQDILIYVHDYKLLLYIHSKINF